MADVTTTRLDQVVALILVVLLRQDTHKVAILHTITKDIVHLVQVAQEDISTVIGDRMEDPDYA